MKRLITLLMSLTVALGLFAGCGGGSDAPTEPTKSQGPSYNYPTINEKLTWEKINAFPIKNENMTEDELRQLCVDFFNFSKTALWIPNTNFTYQKTNKGNTDEMIMGKIYGGLPYIGLASGNIYRLMDYIDEETGVVDMTEPSQNPGLFGNQCSIGAYWGWSRVVNSADYSWTMTMVQSKGFLRVGPYTYDDTIIRYTEGVCDTSMIAKANGEQVMYESYAAMKPADGLVNYISAGHTMMCTAAPVVVYNDDGTINGVQSYVTITDQYSNWEDATNEAGDTYTRKNNVNHQYPFYQLYADAYLPFTFAEFLGTDPVEPTECTYSHTGDSITVSQLRAGEVKANYGISDVYAIIRDGSGTEVFRCAQRASSAGVLSANLYKTIPEDRFEEFADGTYTVEVLCQLGTGERLSLYTGTLTQ